MLDIEWLKIRGFQSFGDYETEIPIGSLGPCLIVGKNGSGKSSILNALTWCLFGRDSRSAKPGKHILSWNCECPCVVSVGLKNGDVITRSYDRSGNTELIVERDGESLVNTLSTTTLQQQTLNRMYGLDWNVFSGSVFFYQYHKSWIEMSDVARRNMIERVFGTDRFSYYANAAKDKGSKITASQRGRIVERDSCNNQISSLEEEFNIATDNFNNFDSRKAERLRAAAVKYKEMKAKLSELPFPDIDKIRQAWGAINQAEAILNKSIGELGDINAKVSTVEGEIRVIAENIRRHNEGDSVCPECGQRVTSAYTSDRVSEHQYKLNALNDTHDRLLMKRDALSLKISELRKKIDAKKPDISVDHALSLINSFRSFEASVRSQGDEIVAIHAESNPFGETCERLFSKIDDLKKRVVEVQALIDEDDALIRHLSYLQDCYNFKDRIKSLSLGSQCRIFNDELRFYLDAFNFNQDVSLNESLAIVADGWNPKYYSGGEMKRVDSALMFAMFNVYEHIHGRQCNIIALDEVDSRMDSAGRDGLMSIIIDDLSRRADSVLLISHHEYFRNIFPNSIVVDKVDGFSVVVDAPYL